MVLHRGVSHHALLKATQLVLLGLPVRTPGGRRVFRLHGDARRTYAYFDEETSTLVAVGATRNVASGDVWLLACVSEDEAIVLVEDRALWRVRFGTDDYEELYRVR